MLNLKPDELRRGLAILASRVTRNNSSQKNQESPLRAELLSAEQLERHAEGLARRHTAEIRPGENLLLARLADNEELLLETFNVLTQAVEKQQELAPAAEWLIDNFYLIEQQIRLARKHLPRSYSRQLPCLTKGPLTGYPRVYEIAMELISHSDGRVETRNLFAFVAAYQKEVPLTIGELWAIPIMLRLALIENIRRIAGRLLTNRQDRTEAIYWVNQMTTAVEKSPDYLILVVADMARADPRLSPSFVAEYARLLQGQSAAFVLPLTWLEQRLASEGTSIEQQVRLANQMLAADQVSISNSINSLRFLDAMDWHEFVEGVSVVEAILRTDPADVYSRMDFSTRDNYRHVVEQLARESGRKEEEVAQLTVDLARKSYQENSSDERLSHVGYYLWDRGRIQLEALLGLGASFRRRIARWCQRQNLLWYLGAISGLTLIILFVFMPAFSGLPIWLVGLSIWLLLVVGSQLSVALVNWLATLLVSPRALPRMDFSRGLPPECRTLIVFPVILSDRQVVSDLIENLEIQYLANADDHVYLALLSDFKDAKQEVELEDASLLEQARSGVENLNRKYQRNGEDVFFLLHRPRVWNERERCWMGHERKRGKLNALNLLIQKGKTDCFSVIIGHVQLLSHVRYVVTLDADCQLPKDAVRQLVGCLEHPLNRPRLDEKKRRVIEGYGILQPRVATNLISANRSLYARFFSGEPGLDPYTRVVSDVYQDLFQEGSFVGKGIYRVETFSQVLEDRFPENLILSHDLLEGCYVRCGLVSDVQVYENFPARYSADAKRKHRWLRGDWQILPWLFPRVPCGEGTWVQNPLNGLSRWKIFDNIRRSLVPPSLLLLVIIGWLALEPP
ncbi:MAG: cyclic beta 1-2 glucan synthetase, partial [Candidatus Omnitrophica bacterium]|nr:cyclic beta 1-2 glucan synthetase [Candidatus Omnitrophota bacterium]